MAINLQTAKTVFIKTKQALLFFIAFVNSNVNSFDTTVHPISGATGVVQGLGNWLPTVQPALLSREVTPSSPFPSPPSPFTQPQKQKKQPLNQSSKSATQNHLVAISR